MLPSNMNSGVVPNRTSSANNGHSLIVAGARVPELQESTSRSDFGTDFWWLAHLAQRTMSSFFSIPLGLICRPHLKQFGILELVLFPASADVWERNALVAQTVQS